MEKKKGLFSMKRLTSRDLALISLFIAIQIILTRFASIQTPVVRIDFNFLAVSMCAAIFGPIWGGIAAVIADFLGVMIFPVAGGYFPGFSLTVFLSAFTYGIFLYNRPKTYINILIPVLICTFVFSVGLNTIWVMMLTGKGYMVLLPLRAAKSLLMIPIELFLIHWIWNAVGARVSMFAANASNASDN